MATGNFFLGNARRKLGDVVMYRRNGKQVSRIRVTPKNPRSQKQNYQRMVFATLTKMASSLSSIVNHSFEGVKVGGASLNHFVRINTSMARAKAYAAGGIADNFPAGFLIKSAQGVACLPARISSGHLSPISQEFVESAPGQCQAKQLGVTDPQGKVLGTITNAQDYIDALAALGFQPGQQLTMVGIFTQIDDQGLPVQSYSYEATGAENIWTWPEFARVVFKQVEEVDFSTPFPFLLYASDMTTFNSRIMDLEKSSSWVRGMSVEKAPGDDYVLFKMHMESSIVTGVASALIKSSYNGDGSWSYSTTDLCWSDDLLSWFAGASAALVAPSYGNAASAPDSTLYLRQADNGAPVAPGADAPAITGLAASASYEVDGNFVTFTAGGSLSAFQLDFITANIAQSDLANITATVDGSAAAVEVDGSQLATKKQVDVSFTHSLEGGEVLPVSVLLSGKVLWSGHVYMTL
jgi:hypothetical protein